MIPATSNGTVERQVVRIVTPGTLVEDALARSPACESLLAALLFDGEERHGLAWLDLGQWRRFAVSELGQQSEVAADWNGCDRRS